MGQPCFYYVTTSGLVSGDLTLHPSVSKALALATRPLTFLGVTSSIPTSRSSQFHWQRRSHGPLDHPAGKDIGNQQTVSKPAQALEEYKARLGKRAA